MQEIDLMTTAFTPGGRIPDRYTCAGEGASPALQWRKIPSGAKSLALIVDDPDASGSPGGPFAHWVLYNIPPDLDGLEENFSGSQSAVAGRNSFGEARYGGPCPPPGEPHHYYFRLYALDQRLDLGPGATRAQLIDAMRGHILAETELIGLYGRENF